MVEESSVAWEVGLGSVAWEVGLGRDGSLTGRMG